MIAKLQRNTSKLCWVQHVARVFPPVVTFWFVGSNLTIFKLEPTTPNTSLQGVLCDILPWSVAIVWPGLSSTAERTHSAGAVQAGPFYWAVVLPKPPLKISNFRSSRGSNKKLKKLRTLNMHINFNDFYSHYFSVCFFFFTTARFKTFYCERPAWISFQSRTSNPPQKMSSFLLKTVKIIINCTN